MIALENVSSLVPQVLELVVLGVPANDLSGAHREGVGLAPQLSVGHHPQLDPTMTSGSSRRGSPGR